MACGRALEPAPLRARWSVRVAVDTGQCGERFGDGGAHAFARGTRSAVSVGDPRPHRAADRLGRHAPRPAPRLAQRRGARLPRLDGRQPARARNERDRRLRAQGQPERRGREGAHAQAAHRRLCPGEDLHRPLEFHPQLDAVRTRARPAAGARHRLGGAARRADGGSVRLADRAAQGPAGAGLPRHQCLRHAVPGRLLQAARGHAGDGSGKPRKAAPAPAPAQGDHRSLARGKRGAQGRTDAHDRGRDGLSRDPDPAADAARR